MYLSVQLAARRLGVSSYTVRRWTESGLLPCIRTAGGHRRIRREDVDELAYLIADGDHLSARLAREREIETLVEGSIALTSHLDLTSLLVEIARRVSAVLDCHFCAISEYDPATTMVHVLADFDRHGRRVTDWKPYPLTDYPFTKALVEERELAVLTVSDPGADPAEVAVMRAYGDKTMLVIPLVDRDRAVGFLEVYDHLRERRFTRQELRFARALAGLATIALRNAKIFAELSRCTKDARRLQEALDELAEGASALAATSCVEDALRNAALLACRALGSSFAVAAWGDVVVRVGDGAGDAVTATAGTPAPCSVSAKPAEGSRDDARRILRLIAASAASTIRGLTSGIRG